MKSAVTQKGILAMINSKSKFYGLTLLLVVNVVFITSQNQILTYLFRSLSEVKMLGRWLFSFVQTRCNICWSGLSYPLFSNFYN